MIDFSILTPIITGVTVFSITFIINKSVNSKEKRKEKVAKETELLSSIAVRIDGIESTSKRIDIIADEFKELSWHLKAREIICDNRHQWDGLKWDGVTERRKVS
jgi:hypothetical protein